MSDLTLEDLGDLVVDGRNVFPVENVGEATIHELNEKVLMRIGLDGSMIVQTLDGKRSFVLDWRSAISLAVHKGLFDAGDGQGSVSADDEKAEPGS